VALVLFSASLALVLAASAASAAAGTTAAAGASSAPSSRPAASATTAATAGGSSTSSSQPAGSAKGGPAASSTKEKAPPPDPNVPEKTFALMLPNGTKVQAKVFPNHAWPGKIIHFDPYFPRNDGNLHSVALNSMWEIYGRQRGSFQIQDASISSRPKIGAIIVYALKSGSKFCVYPVSTDEKGMTLAAIKVWIE
jgi:hypothetical protein